MHTLKEDLLAVKTLIGKSENWTRHVWAMDSAGNYLRTGADPAACRWCLMGALERVCEGANVLDRYRYLCGIAREHSSLFDHYNSPVSVNDALGFEAVHKLLDLAIEAAGHKMWRRVMRRMKCVMRYRHKPASGVSRVPL